MAPNNKNKAASASDLPPSQMPTGTTTWSTKDKQVAKRATAPAGVYDAILLTSKMEVRSSNDNPASPPRAAGIQLKLTTPDGKTVVVFHDFHGSLAPGKDGVIMPERNGQVVEFTHARGVELEAQVLTHEYPDEQGEMQRKQYLDPQAIISTVKNFEGKSVRVKIKLEKDNRGDMQNKVDSWLPDAQ